MRSPACRIFASSLLPIVLLWAGAPALAADEGGFQDEIVITAERREGSVQDTPVAVSAFSGEDLDAAGYYDFEDLSTNIPNVQFGRELVGSGGITIRGISSSSGDRATAFHLDGVYVDEATAVQGITFFDVRRVEVLRGPQGTLYGRNATGGAINIVSVPPGPDFEAFGDVQFGSYSEVLARGVLNIPLVEDRVYVRSAFLSNRRNGFQDNISVSGDDADADDADQLAFRTQLRVLPHDDVDFTFRHIYTQSQGVGPGQKVLKPFPESVNLAGPLFVDLYCQSPAAPPGCDITPNPSGVREIGLDQVGALDNYDHRLNGEVTVDVPELPFLGETRVKALASWFFASRFSITDQDGSDGDIVTVWVPSDTSFRRVGDVAGGDYELETISGCDANAFAGGADPMEAGCGFGTNERTEWVFEAQWSSDDHRALQWVTGFFFLDTEAEADTFAATFPTPDLAVPVLSVIDNEARSYAGFGQVDYTFGRDSETVLDDWTLTLGARVSHDEKRTRRQTPEVLVGPFTLQALIDATPDTPGGALGIEDEWTAWSGTARGEWRWRAQSLAYFSVSRGYKAGFVNNALFDTADPSTLVPTADPEYLWAFELGSKNRLLDNRLQVNVTGFAYIYDDLQVSQLVGISIATQNATSATVLGLELETVALPFDGVFDPLEDLRLLFNLGLLDATFGDFEDCALPEGQDVIDCSGNRLTYAPVYTISIVADWPFDLGDFGTLTPWLRFYASGEVQYRPSNCPNAECLALLGDPALVNDDAQEPYRLLDLRLGWATPDGRLSITAFVDNVTDEDIIQSQVVGSRAIGSPIQVRFDAPRTAGLRVGVRW